MSKIVEEVLAAHREYGKRYGKMGKLPMPPSRLHQGVPEATRIGKTS
jgi:hypothetical protein